MNDCLQAKRFRQSFIPVCLIVTLTGLSGCTPNYRTLRYQGQKAMVDGSYGPARHFFKEAEMKDPRHLENLHDMGACSVMLAKQQFAEMNQAAAMRELDAALAYYNQAIEVYPAHQASLEGKTTTLELRGQFDEALRHAQWAAEFVGPAAKQYIFLAGKLEERGDVDGALLRYRQAVAVEPKNPAAHVAFAKFLLRHNKEDAAVHHLQAAYRLDPLNGWVVDELSKRSALPTLAPESK